MTQWMKLGTVAMLMPLIAACGSDVDTSATPDPVAKTALFVPDGQPAAPSVALREAGIVDKSITLEVVGYGLDGVYGSSFRIETDAALTLSTFDSDYAVSRAIQARTGLGFFVATAAGKSAGRLVDGDVIGTVRFERTAAAGSGIRFVDNRSDIVDPSGVPMPDVQWISGELRVE